MNSLATALSRCSLVLALGAAGCVVDVSTPGGTSVVFSENFDLGGGRWTLGDGFSIDSVGSAANPDDRWLRAVYDDSCSDQSYNFAYVTVPFDFSGATNVSVSFGYSGRYGTRDTTGLAWTTDLPGAGATWNSLSELPTSSTYVTNSVDLPSAARRSGVYLGIYFRNVCVRNSIGVNMGYDDFKVVVTR